MLPKATLTLQTGETTIADGDTLGKIDFIAPDEAAGTDAILTAAGIHARAGATFSASVNNTELILNLVLQVWLQQL